MPSRKGAAKSSKAKPTTPAKPPRKVGKSGAAGKHDNFHVEGRTWRNPETGAEETLPSIDDFVADCYLTLPRWMIVRETVRRYGCGVRTVDTHIAKVKADYEEVLMERRAQRVSKHLARLDIIFRKALAADDFGAAVQSVKTNAQIAGDILKTPETQAPDHAEEMTDEQLAKIAAREKRGKPGAGG